MKQCELDLKEYILSTDNVDFDDISQNYILSEEFIREFALKVNWILISKHQKLSEEFIKEFKHCVYWSNVFVYQKLSEEFIEKNTFDSSEWGAVSLYQNLSKNFIINHFDKLRFSLLRKNKNFKFDIVDVLLSFNDEVISCTENNINLIASQY